MRRNAIAVVCLSIAAAILPSHVGGSGDGERHFLYVAEPGIHAYPSTGEVIDTATKKIVTALSDEKGRMVQSEKVVEIVFDGTRAVRTGDQFGIGRRR